MSRVISKIIVHCSATPPDMDIGVAQIREWHLQRGFKDIGYHYVIRRDGRVETGRPVAEQGAHCAARGGNKNSIGVCLVGGVRRAGRALYTQNNFAPVQFDALDTLVRRLLEKHPIDTLLGHRDLDPGKDCPSFSVRDMALARGWHTRTWA